MRHSLLALSLFIAGRVFAEQATLLKDVETTTTPYGSEPVIGRTVGGLTYFSAATKEHGRELWRTDGTTAGTFMVKDIEPGSESALAGNSDTFLGDVNGRVVFMARVGGVDQVWSSDGTEAGTQFVASLRISLFAGSRAATANGYLFLSALAPGTGEGLELWRTDGTAAGTQQIVIRPGINGSVPRCLIAVGNVVYFFAVPPENIPYLYRSDGSAAGTVQLAQVPFGEWLTFSNGRFFYRETVGSTYELRSIDSSGTTVTTLRSGFVGGAENADNIIPFAYGNGVVFRANDGVHGRELWRSDGTAAGTTMVADLAPGTADAYAYDFAVVGPHLYFLAGPDDTHRLYRFDGSSATLAYDLGTFAGGASAFLGDYVFVRDTTAEGSELWRFDPDSGQVFLVADINAGSGDGHTSYEPWAILGDRLILSASDEVFGQELFVSDGTPAGTTLLKNVVAEIPNSSYPVGMLNAGGRLSFVQSHLTNAKLWSSDGTEAGTTLARAFDGGFRIIEPRVVTEGRFAYFVGGIPNGDHHLYRTDGTSAGTIPLILGGGGAAAYEHGVLFRKQDGTFGNEPWTSDGTVAGTRMIEDVVPGSGSVPFDTEFTVAESGLGFFASGHNRIARTDGTGAGTFQLLTEGKPPIVAVDGVTYFTRDGTATRSWELWKTDGTDAGTVKVKIFDDGDDNRYLVDGGGKLLIIRNGNKDIWRSDGTEAGTVLVAAGAWQPRFHCESLEPRWAKMGSVVYWLSGGDAYTTPWKPLELWRTDGTTAGTYKVYQFAAGLQSPGNSCAASWLVAESGRLYFVGVDSEHGSELWTSDGTTAGTRHMADIYPGTESSGARWLTRLGSRLYFSAFRPDVAYEPFWVPLPRPPARPTDFGNDGKSDLFWRNRWTGENALWTMEGTSVRRTTFVRATPASWALDATADFDGDGRTDLLWRDAGGASVMWLMDGVRVRSTGTVAHPASQWTVAGSGDFNGDGLYDLLWRNSATREAAIWFMRGYTIASSAVVASPAAEWTLIGSGDLDGDGLSDLVWRNSETQQVWAWLMNGASIREAVYVATPNVDWAIEAVGDFGGDGKADLLWRNRSTGETVMWRMNGGAIVSTAYLATPSSDWQLQAATDFDGDGRCDAMWRNTINGQNAVWLMNDASVASAAYLPAIEQLAWDVIAR